MMMLSIKDAVGLGIAIAGLLLFLTSFLIVQSQPLAAMGIGVIVSGLSVVLTPLHVAPKRALRESLVVFSKNLDAILESLNVKGKAIYTWINGKPLLMIPLRSRPVSVPPSCNLGLGVIGGEPYLCLEPPLPGAEVSEGKTDEHALNLSEYLVERISAATSASYTRSGNIVVATISNPKLPLSPGRMSVATGSLPSLLAGILISSEIRETLVFLEERFENNSLIATFEVISK